MRRLLDMPVARALTLGAAVMFGVFFIAAAVATGYYGREGASVVAGVLSYAYLMYAVVIVGHWFVTRPKGAERAVKAYLLHHPAMASWIIQYASFGVDGLTTRRPGVCAKYVSGLSWWCSIAPMCPP